MFSGLNWILAFSYSDYVWKLIYDYQNQPRLKTRILYGSEFGSLVDFLPTMGPADVAKVDGLTDTSTKTKYQVYVLSAEAKYYKLVVA